MGAHFPAIVPLGDVHQHCDSLSPKFLRHAIDQTASGRRTSDKNLLDACGNQRFAVDNRTHTTTVSQRHEALGSDSTDEIHVRTATIHRGVNIEEADLVYLLLVENTNDVEGISDVNLVGKPSSLDKPPRAIEKENRNDPRTHVKSPGQSA